MDFLKNMDVAIFASYRMPRPGNGIGLLVGILGSLMMLLSVAAYVPRKRLESWQFLGQKQYWLDLHMISGLSGAVLVLFHAVFAWRRITGLANLTMWGTVASGILYRFFSMRISDAPGGNGESAADFWWKIHVSLSIFFGIYLGMHVLVVFLFKPRFVFF